MSSRYLTSARLAVEIHADAARLGLAAARAAAAYIQGRINRQGEARVIFACAPSQNEFLRALADPDKCHVVVDWSRVTAFHMDEYLGLPATHPQSFRHYLHEHFLQHVRIGAFHPLNAEEPDTAAVVARYATLLEARPLDFVCMGIGENGHIAFNDPPVADFEDPSLVKIVELDHACRQQQVNDGCFQTLNDVPRHALTLTIPVFRQATRLSIHVPGSRKASAVRATIEDRISTQCPASILRLHPNATLYLDVSAAALLA